MENMVWLVSSSPSFQNDSEKHKITLAIHNASELYCLAWSLGRRELKEGLLYLKLRKIKLASRE